MKFAFDSHAFAQTWERIQNTPVTPGSRLKVSGALFMTTVLLSGLIVAMMMGTGKASIAFGLGMLMILYSFGAVLIRQVRLEVLAGWMIIPVVLFYPQLRSQIGFLPALNSVRVYLVALIAGLIFLNPASSEERTISRMTIIFRIATLSLIVLTGLSAFFVTDATNTPVVDWLNMVLIFGAGLIATYLKSPLKVLQAIVAAARPLAIMLGLIAITEYALGASLYGMEMRVDGLDRRVPGPFFSAEVFGYFFSVLVALILFHKHRYAKSRNDRLLNNTALFLSIIGTILTFFRSGWVSLIAVLFIYTLFHLPKAFHYQRFIQWLVLLSPVFVLSAALIAVTLADAPKTNGSPIPFMDTLQERLSGSASQNSAGNRTTLARSAWLMVQDKPWGGVGFSQYPPQMLRYIPSNLPTEQFDVIYKAYDVSDWAGKVAHNSYVQIVAECGIPVLLLLLLTQFLPVYALFTQRKKTAGSDYVWLALAIVLSTATSFLSQSMLYYGDAALVWTSLILGILIRISDPFAVRDQPINTIKENDFWTPPV